MNNLSITRRLFRQSNKTTRLTTKAVLIQTTLIPNGRKRCADEHAIYSGVRTPSCILFSCIVPVPSFGLLPLLPFMHSSKCFSNPGRLFPIRSSKVTMPHQQTTSPSPSHVNFLKWSLNFSLRTKVWLQRHRKTRVVELRWALAVSRWRISSLLFHRPSLGHALRPQVFGKSGCSLIK